MSNTKVLSMIDYIKRVQDDKTLRFYYLKRFDHFQRIINRYHAVNENSRPKRVSGE